MTKSLEDAIWNLKDSKHLLYSGKKIKEDTDVSKNILISTFMETGDINRPLDGPCVDGLRRPLVKRALQGFPMVKIDKFSNHW